MCAKAGEPQDIREILGGLAVEELRAVLLSAVDRHPDAERHVRLVVARASGDLVQLRGEVVRQLDDEGFAHFKRTINQNYFAWVPHAIRDPQLRAVARS